MAIPVSQDVKTALAAPVKQLRSVITWTGADMTPHQITSEDRIISIKKEAEGYYFASALRKVTITTVGTEMDLLDQDVQITIQVKLPGGTWGNIPWGTFAIREAKATENKETVTFTGYAGIYRLQEREYTGGELTFPNTVGGLIQDLATGMGLTINPEIVLLPGNYQRLEYIENSTTSYFSFPFSLTGADTVTMDVDIASAPSTGWATLWSCRTDTQTNTVTSFLNISTNTEARADYGNNQRSFTLTSCTGKHTFKADKGDYYVDGVQKVTRSASTFTGGSVTTIMASNQNGSDIGNHGLGKIYSFKVERAESVIHNMIPAKRRSDNVVGLYDYATGTFYTSTGGSFTAGPDVHTLPNADAPINEDLWANITGTTYRDILEELAGATGTLAVIGGGDDTLDLNPVPVDTVTDTTDESHLITFKIGQEWGPANAVVLSRQPQGDNIEAVDEESTQKPGGKNLLLIEPTTSVFDGTYVSGANTNEYKTKATGSDHYINQVGSAGQAWGDRFGNLMECEYGETLYYQTGNDLFTKNFFTEYNEAGVAINFWHTGQASGTYTPHSSNCKFVTFRFGYGNATSGTEYTTAPIVSKTPLTAGSYEPYIPRGRIDVVVTNNQILDKQRETTATPLLDAVLGWQYREATYKTEGHGYHEIGDRIDVTIDDTTYPTIVTKSVIIVDGGINETLTSTTPEKVAIDYSKAGGITKTIYNTELAVDKQHQEIEAIVSRQDQTDETISENYTRLLQTINNIQATVQVSGGGNLIKNSVGFGKQSDGTLTVWQYGTGADTTTVKSQSSTASLNAGAISGHEIDLTGATISQNVQLTAGETYNLSFRVQKSAVGAATVTITDGINTTSITAQDQTAYNWNQLNADFTPTAGGVTVTLTTSNCTAAITDLMLAQGGRTGWRQASGEIYNLQVSVDQDGVQVKSATYAGDYTAITPLEFAGYSNAGGTMKKVFTINRDVTEVEKLKANSQIKMPPMEIVPIDNANYKGWAFVKSPD